MPLDDAMVLAEQLRRGAAAPIGIATGEVLVIGQHRRCQSPAGRPPGPLLLRAEASMTRARDLGRDMVCAYSQEDMLRVEDRRMLGALARGAAGGRALSDYQPQVSAGSGRMLGFEACCAGAAPSWAW